jgi:hypothetical protein
MTLWTPGGKLKRYDTAFDALKDFVSYRVEKFEERRLKQIDLANEELDFLRNKKLFILEWNGLPNPGKMKGVDIEEHMKLKGVKEIYITRLMSLRISSLTLELIAELDSAIKAKQVYIVKLEKSTARELFIDSLQTL